MSENKTICLLHMFEEILPKSSFTVTYGCETSLFRFQYYTIIRIATFFIVAKKLKPKL